MSNYENVATRNRKAKQEALRDYLEGRGLVQHIFELLEKIEDESTDIDANLLARYKTGIDTRLKLVNKYLPDLKHSEVDHGIQEDNPLGRLLERVMGKTLEP